MLLKREKGKKRKGKNGIRGGKEAVRPFLPGIIIYPAKMGCLNFHVISIHLHNQISSIQVQYVFVTSLIIGIGEKLDQVCFVGVQLCYC